MPKTDKRVKLVYECEGPAFEQSGCLLKVSLLHLLLFLSSCLALATSNSLKGV